MKAEGQRYDTDVKKARKGHGKGPPSIYVARALMEALIKVGVGIGANAFKILTEYIQVYDQLTSVEKAQVCPMCCLKKCEKKDTLKLIFAFGNETPPELRKAMRVAVDNLEGTSFSPGRAPHFGPELAAQDILELITKAGS